MLHCGVYVGFTIINTYRLYKYILILYSVGDRNSDMLVNFRKTMSYHIAICGMLYLFQPSPLFPLTSVTCSKLYYT